MSFWLPRAKKRWFDGLYPTPLAHYALGNRYGWNQTVLRARRASDNVEADFKGFEVSNGVLRAWAGGNAFVVTLYDLTGNGHDITQATSTNQPTIVMSGVLMTAAGAGWGDFSESLSGWSTEPGWSHSGGTLTATNAAAYKHARWGAAMAAGSDTRYFPERLDFTISFDYVVTSGQLAVFFGDDGSGGSTPQFISGSGSRSYSADISPGDRHTLFFRSNNPSTPLNATITNIKITPQVDTLGPAMFFDNDDELVSSSISGQSFSSSVFLVFADDFATYSSGSGTDAYFNIGVDGTDGRHYFGRGTSYTGNQMGVRYGGTTGHDASTNGPAGLSVLSSIATATDGDAWLNGSSIVSITPTIGAAGTNRTLRLGDSGGNGGLNGRVSEFIVYDDDQTSNRGDVESFLNDKHSI